MRHLRIMTLLLASVALMLLPLSVHAGIGVKKNPHTSGAGNATVYDVTDATYGAMADAVEASGCDAGEDTPIDCTTPGTGTNDGPAITAAAAAAGAAGGGVVLLPCGNYRTGSAPNFYTGSILIQDSNITLEGQGECTVLLPDRSTGQLVIGVCAENNCDGTTQLENVHIRNVWIKDDDPFAHGFKNGYVLEATTVGTFDYMENVTFSGGGTGRFWWQEGIGAGPETMIFIIDSGTPVATETITGIASESVATIDSVTDAVLTGEESHGVHFANCTNCSFTNSRVSHMGDEGVEINHDSRNVRVEGNYFDNVPGVPTSSAAVMVYEATGTLITNNGCE